MGSPSPRMRQVMLHWGIPSGAWTDLCLILGSDDSAEDVIHEKVLGYLQKSGGNSVPNARSSAEWRVILRRAAYDVLRHSKVRTRNVMDLATCTDPVEVPQPTPRATVVAALAEVQHECSRLPGEYVEACQRLGRNADPNVLDEYRRAAELLATEGQLPRGEFSDEVVRRVSLKRKVLRERFGAVVAATLVSLTGRLAQASRGVSVKAAYAAAATLAAAILIASLGALVDPVAKPQFAVSNERQKPTYGSQSVRPSASTLQVAPFVGVRAGMHDIWSKRTKEVKKALFGPYGMLIAGERGLVVLHTSLIGEDERVRLMDQSFASNIYTYHSKEPCFFNVVGRELVLACETTNHQVLFIGWVEDELCQVAAGVSWARPSGHDGAESGSVWTHMGGYANRCGVTHLPSFRRTNIWYDVDARAILERVCSTAQSVGFACEGTWRLERPRSREPRLLVKPGYVFWKFE